MILLDIAILVTFVYLIYTGLNAGLMREGIVVLAAVVGITLAGVAYDSLANDIENFVDDRQDSLRVAFLALVGAVVLAGVIVSYLIKSSLSVFYLGSLDSVGGAVLGGLKALVLIEAVLVVFQTFPALGMESAMDDSVLSGLLLEELPLIKPLLPGEFDFSVDSV